jgi:dGTPase
LNWPQLLSPSRSSDKSTITLTSQTRTRFEQDYDRIIFSHPFRKLQDKTQVIPLPEDDFVHNRLTHSLEVSSVGRSLANEVGKRILERDEGLAQRGISYHDFGSIVAAACLAHDIGNPPFGHAGEASISGFFNNHPEGQFFRDKVTSEEWNDLSNFEGNAQGFRILNDPNYGGLRLTHATLATFTKYPIDSSSQKDNERKSQKKYGFNSSDKTVFAEIASEIGLTPLGKSSWTRHPLAFLVEAADDICYHIIDLEDGTRLGLIPLETTVQLLAQIIGERFSQSKLDLIQDVNEKLGILRALAIHELITSVTDCFLSHETHLLAGSFDQSLLSKTDHVSVLKQISKLSIDKIYQSRGVLMREAAGYQIMENLLAVFCLAAYTKHHDKTLHSQRNRAMYHMFPDSYQQKLAACCVSVYQTLQIVMDYLSGLTDKSALKLHKVITGQINSE